MNQIPCVPINPYMVQQQVPQQPNYNAVKIDIHNPTVGTPGMSIPQTSATYAQPTMPYYNYPQQQIYSYPQAQQPEYYPPQINPQQPPVQIPASICYPIDQQAQGQQPAVCPATTVAQIPAPAVTQAPQPQAGQQNINIPVPVQTTVAPAPTVPEPVVSKTPETVQNAPKPDAKPEVVPSETVSPQVDINQFIAKLTNPDFDVQASAMEEIANVVKQSPEKATELVDSKVFDALTGIINFDSSKLQGQDKENAERNKSFGLFTTAIMQKLYADEVARLSKQTVPLTELPGAITVVDALKDNPNPMVRDRKSVV